MDDMEAKYRALFLTDMGQEVLTDILVNFCFFGQFHDPAGNAELDGAYNVGMKIVSRMGMLKDQKAYVRGVCSAIAGTRLVVPLEEDKNEG